MHGLIDISTSSENYLETIYTLSKETGTVRSIDVAHKLSVSKASVNKAISILREAGMVEQELYGSITLTERGKQRAAEVYRRHCILKTFLTEVLHVDEAIAEGDACRMEHVITDATMTKWADYLEDILGDGACKCR